MPRTLHTGVITAQAKPPSLDDVEAELGVSARVILRYRDALKPVCSTRENEPRDHDRIRKGDAGCDYKGDGASVRAAHAAFRASVRSCPRWKTASFTNRARANTAKTVPPPLSQ